MPIPGSSDVVHAARAIRDGVKDAVALGPRLFSVIGRVEDVLGRVETVLGRVETVVGRIEGTSRRVESVVDLYEPPLTKLAPSLQSFSEKLEPHEVTAMIELVDRLPRLLTHLDEDVIPILTTLDRVAPDLHQLLEIAQDLQVALSGLPGMGWLRKRAEKEEQEAEQLAREIEATTLKPVGKPKAKVKPKG